MDVPYVRTFHHRLAPAWLDHAALLSGFAPPPRSDGFAWCELGCGLGVTPTLLAATHPRGQFFGIDAMANHIDHARGLADEAIVANVSFIACDFIDTGKLRLPKFDYIVAHGVYSWIDPTRQDAMLRFIDRRLKPGGLVYLSYNAMHAWAPVLPLQRLLVEFSRTVAGDGLARLAGAAEIVRALVDARAPALLDNWAVAGLASDDKHYLAHEYLSTSWKPLYVTEVRAATAAIGLAPAGAARLIENYDNFVLGKAARKVIAAISNDDLRELARDFFVNSHLRCDVFVRDGRRLDEAERSRRLFGSTLALARPAAAIRYSMKTPGGTLNFNNDVSRGIVAALAAGPRSLAEIQIDSTLKRDRLANALALCAAEEVWPVERDRVAVERLSQTIYRRLDGPQELLFLPLNCGTAIAAERGLLRRLRDGLNLGDYPGWRDFLATQSA